uniref:ubiquitinyl hydrolase 1 n=1 Tax=Chinchilla lanigera TaxID=34839 RepID=A0A8C2YI29_CHILA
IESIFQEKQEGSNLLQGEHFSPVELSSVAHQLDEGERMRMAEGGVTSEDYREFLQQPFGNMDDTGFFSIQWFNLNSLLTGPELISDTHLALFLAQLQQEGYSIFVVRGDLPYCEADQLLQMIRVQQTVLKTDLEQVLEGNDGLGVLDEDEEDLQRALALSRQESDVEDEEAGPPPQGSPRNISQDVPQTPSTNLTFEELRRREQQQRQADPPEQASQLHERPTTRSGALGNDLGDSMNEEDMHQAVVTMSLETVINNLKTQGKNNIF